MGIRGREMVYGVMTYFEASFQRGHHLFLVLVVLVLLGHKLFGGWSKMAKMGKLAF